VSTRLAIMQPYLFPYLGYFQLLDVVDNFILLDDVNFIKRGWVNRNRILINGKAHLFCLPLHKASQFSKINSLRLADYQRWRSRFFKTLAHAYTRAPEYERSLEMLSRALPPKAVWLNELLQTSIKVVCEHLGVTARMESITDHPRATELRGADRILAICSDMGARDYINLPGAGKNLYNAVTFAESGIKLHFLHPDTITYRQFDDHFIPRLSIVDVIMFNKAHELSTLLQAFSLKAPNMDA